MLPKQIKLQLLHVGVSLLCSLFDGIDEALWHMVNHRALHQGVANSNAGPAARQRLSNQSSQQSKHTTRPQEVLLHDANSVYPLLACAATSLMVGIKIGQSQHPRQ